jgi:hypothetical protein
MLRNNIKSSNSDICDHGVAQTVQSRNGTGRVSVQPLSELPKCSKLVDSVVFVPRTTQHQATPNADVQKRVSSQDDASESTKKTLHAQDTLSLQGPHASEAALDDDFISEEEKWRTDRFFLGTHLYVAMNPRALTEKCASGNNCPFHPFCDFAHEPSELREKPFTQMWNFKTKLCDKFHSVAACCPYGNRWYDSPSFRIFLLSAFD